MMMMMPMMHAYLNVAKRRLPSDTQSTLKKYKYFGNSVYRETSTLIKCPHGTGTLYVMRRTAGWLIPFFSPSLYGVGYGGIFSILHITNGAGSGIETDLTTPCAMRSNIIHAGRTLQFAFATQFTCLLQRDEKFALSMPQGIAPLVKRQRKRVLFPCLSVKATRAPRGFRFSRDRTGLFGVTFYGGATVLSKWMYGKKNVK